MFICPAMLSHVLVRRRQALLFRGKAFYDIVLEETISGKYPGQVLPVDDAGIYLKEANAGHRNLKADTICGDAYPLFWHISASGVQGRSLIETREFDLKSGMVVLTWEKNIQQFITTHYQVTPVDNYRSVIVYRIDNMK